MSKLSIVVPVYYNEDTLMDLYKDMQANGREDLPH